MIKKIILCSFFFIAINFRVINAQSFTSYVYNDENGLASNLAKSITQDDDGFIWVATDAGLSKFDGISFINYQQNLPSLYVKQITNTRSHKLEIVTDFGVGSLSEKSGENTYVPLLTSSRDESNQNVYYPKNVFEDSQGNLWISDLTGVSKLQNGHLQKYSFDVKYYADSYFRSFLVTETNNHRIIVSSQQGYLFYFDKTQNKFIKLAFSSPSSNFTISALTKYKGDSFLVGASDGLYLCKFEGNSNSLITTKINDLKQISSIAVNKDGNIFLGTWDDGLYYEQSGANYAFEKLANLNFNSIKDLFIDNQNNLWAASDQGIGLVKKTSFGILHQPVSKINPSLFIQQISSDNKKNIFYSDGNSIFEVKSNDENRSVIKLMTSKTSSILSFAISSEGFWIAYRNQLLEFRDKKSLKVLFSLKLKDDRFNSLFVDKNEQLWAYLARRRQIIKFDKHFKSQTYDFNFSNFDFINLFAQSPDGTIYCAGSGANLFIAKLDNSQKKFIEVSPYYNPGLRTQIQVYDIQFKNNKIYLGTTEGLLYIENNSVHTIELPSYMQDKIIKAIQIDSNKIWLGTEKGIIALLKNGNADFNVQDGLPNSSIANHGLIEDSKKRLWAATASGVCYWQLEKTIFRKTATPVFRDIKIILEGERNSSSNKHEFVSGTSINCSFISLTFPSTRILYEYRLEGFDSSWSSPRYLNAVDLFSLPAGKYLLQVRAKAPGYLWSSIGEFPIKIVPPWYLSTFVLFIYSVVSIIIIVISINSVYNSRIKKMKSKENLLSQMVNERTNDLLIAKTKAEELLSESEEAQKRLEEATEQKSHMLSVAAHDLKNPLQSIIGFSSIIDEDSNDPEIKHMASIILSSSKDMLMQINEMLDAAAVESKNIKLDLKATLINKVLSDVIKNNYKRALQKGQAIITYFDSDCSVLLDEHWFKIAYDNIISNAIKYAPFDTQILATTEVSDSNIMIKVKDEGKGLTSEDMEKLFNRYQRLSAKPTGGETSTGLGLSIVKDIIDFHKGKIWAESVPGSGATFIIQLSIYNHKDSA